MTRSLFGGSAVLACALFTSFFTLDAPTSRAVTPQQPSDSSATRKRIVNPPATPDALAPDVSGVAASGDADDAIKADKTISADAPSAARPQNYVATAYALRGRTASGQNVRRGIIAADRRVLPLGTRVRIDAGKQSGEYLVADTGGAVRGNKIDIWVPSNGEAMRFGRRQVRLTVLQYPRGKGAPKAQAKKAGQAKR